jgi:ZIP family zinc transporter
MFFIALIDKLIPSYENPHEMHKVEELKTQDEQFKSLHRMGLFTALAIAIHNFPEGIATFAAALKSPAVGIPIAVAIAIHNIPEGIAVSVPIFYATGSRKKAFVYSFLSGLSEPVGAVAGFAIMYSFFNDIIFGVLFASVAGVMVFISLDELLPSAQRYGEHHLSIYGLTAGMVVMAISLLMFL